MRHFQASAVERRIFFNTHLTSHPMEAGWASEAIFFLIVEEIKGEARLNAHVEISPDGINWINEGSRFPEITSPGYYFCKVAHFGNWLRVHGDITGGEIKASVQLHLKS